MMEEKVKKIVCEELCLNENEIRNDARLVEDWAADSLSVISILADLEDEFDIEIDLNDAKKISRYEDILTILTQKYHVKQSVAVSYTHLIFVKERFAGRGRREALRLMVSCCLLYTSWRFSYAERRMFP